MFKCLNCGNLFDEGELKIVSEPRGEFWGMPCYENVEVSPCCNDDFIYIPDDSDQFTDPDEITDKEDDENE